MTTCEGQGTLGFEYQPLRNDEIRLLRIHPRSSSKQSSDIWDGPIHCDLHHYPLVEPSPAGELATRLSNRRSVWDNSTPKLRFRIVDNLKEHQTRRLKIRNFFSRQSTFEGRFSWGDYVALSYTWGKEEETSEIFLNGKPFKIRPNLECALRVLRDKALIRAGMKIWVDALCINQHDLDERSSQVPRMREMYQRAFKVVVWLGPETEDSGSAMRLVRILATSWRADEGESLAKSIAENPYFWHSKIERDGGSMRNCWAGMRSLILAGYWKRVWIVQELAMGGRESPILYGEACVDFGEICDAAALWMMRHAPVASGAMLWDCLQRRSLQQRMEELRNIGNSLEPTQENFPELAGRAANIMKDVESILDTQNNEQWAFHIDRITFIESVADRLKKESVVASHLDNLVGLGRSSDATQAQDKIYGFLSLMDPEFALQFKVDYKRTASQVFTDFSINWITWSKRLNLFVHCSLEHNHTPSWVPDWNFNASESIPPVYIGEAHDNYFAGGLKTLLDVKFSADTKRMEALGMIVDKIDGLTTADNEGPECIHQGSATIEGDFVDVRKALWLTLIGNREYVTSDTTVRQDENEESFLDVPLPSSTTSTLPEPYNRGLFKFIETNQTFLVNGLRLDQYFSNNGERVEISKDSMPEASKGLKVRKQIFVASLLLQQRRLATTTLGTLAVVPRATKPGDIVAILVGCGQPLILRPDDDSFKVVGTAYVHGMMEGEFMTEEKLLGIGGTICLS